MAIDDLLDNIEQMRRMVDWRGLDATPTDERDAEIREAFLELLETVPQAIADLRAEAHRYYNSILMRQDENDELRDENEDLKAEVKRLREALLNPTLNTL